MSRNRNYPTHVGPSKRSIFVTSPEATTLLAPLRERLNDGTLTMYQLSRRTNIAESSLSRFLSGEQGLSSKSLDRLGAVLSSAFSWNKEIK